MKKFICIIALLVTTTMYAGKYSSSSSSSSSRSSSSSSKMSSSSSSKSTSKMQNSPSSKQYVTVNKNIQITKVYNSSTGGYGYNYNSRQLSGFTGYPAYSPINNVLMYMAISNAVDQHYAMQTYIQNNYNRGQINNGQLRDDGYYFIQNNQEMRATNNPETNQLQYTTTCFDINARDAENAKIAELRNQANWESTKRGLLWFFIITGTIGVVGFIIFKLSC